MNWPVIKEALQPVSSPQRLASAVQHPPFHLQGPPYAHRTTITTHIPAESIRAMHANSFCLSPGDFEQPHNDIFVISGRSIEERGQGEEGWTKNGLSKLYRQIWQHDLGMRLARTPEVHIPKYARPQLITVPERSKRPASTFSLPGLEPFSRIIHESSSAHLL